MGGMFRYLRNIPFLRFGIQEENRLATQRELLEEMGIEKYVADPDLRNAIRILRGQLKARERRMKGLMSGYPKRTKKRKNPGSPGSQAPAESGGHESGET